MPDTKGWETWTKAEDLGGEVINVSFDLEPGREVYRITRDQLISLLVAAGYNPKETSDA